MKVSFKQALNLLLKGELVALPTETVYGLAGRMDKQQTIKKIFDLKKRPRFNPLILHCYNKQQALNYLLGDGLLESQLFDCFSPGPLTIVAKKNKKVSPLITGGKGTVALRIPKHPLMQNILKALPVPLVAPSANVYKKISPVKALQVLDFFKGQVPVLDGGTCKKGLESTIITLDKKNKTIKILRPGIITKQKLTSFVKKHWPYWQIKNQTLNFYPGGGGSHYQPPAPLYIVESHKSIKQIKAFLSQHFPNKQLLELKLDKNAELTARKLYSKLWLMSQKDKSVIFIKKTKKNNGLWETIWNRLNKASSGYYKLP